DRQASAREAVDDLLVSGNGERREHEIGLETLHAFDVDAEVGTDLRETPNHLDRIVRVIVDADEKICAAERADDLGVRAGVTDDTQATSSDDSARRPRTARS